ncbi:MAG: PspC domain-containing protein [Coriobacteriales bacterium]|jgi:phage shock protein PspC (stress-responsive transcriptional regulator)|nr:PspC domain-containing protein [Coriobacteriales bacterium]
MNTHRRLFKSDDPVFAGVCGGVAEYFELDPTLIRILAVVVVLAGVGLPIIAYFIAMIIMPKRSGDYPNYIEVQPAATQATGTTQTTAATQATGATGAVSATGWTGAVSAHTNESAPPAAPAAGPTQPHSAAPAAYAAATNGAATTAPFPPVPFGAPAPGTMGSAATAPNTTPAPGSSNTQNATGATVGAGKATPPGCAYTTCNPKAYDAASPADQVPGHRHGHARIRTGVMGGIVLVAIGVLALFAIFFDLSVWRFWPAIIMVMGFMMLCTPSRSGWSLERAGHAISCITVGFTLQLWTLEVISGNAFFHTFMHLWPILLVILGLSVIGSATEQSVFKLFGSLLFSATLLLGVWSFGQLGGPIRIDLPGDRTIEFIIPSPQLLIPDSALTSLDGATDTTDIMTLTPRR